MGIGVERRKIRGSETEPTTRTRHGKGGWLSGLTRLSSSPRGPLISSSESGKPPRDCTVQVGCCLVSHRLALTLAASHSRRLSLSSSLSSVHQQSNPKNDSRYYVHDYNLNIRFIHFDLRERSMLRLCSSLALAVS